MIVSMMQPTFLPWIGYFELMKKADIFIILDDFQFVYQSYHQKNKLLVNKDTFDWYTVPIDKSNSFKKLISEAKIKETLPWRNKMWKSIENNYRKAKYFSVYEAEIKNIILEPTTSLLEQNMRFINFIAEILVCKEKIKFSSMIDKTGMRSEEIISILKAIGGTTYLSAHGSFEYMHEDNLFPRTDIKVLFQNHIPKAYQQQRTKEFIPYLSTLDVLLNVGSEGINEIVEGTSSWLTWGEMVGRYYKECRSNE